MVVVVLRLFLEDPLAVGICALKLLPHDLHNRCQAVEHSEVDVNELFWELVAALPGSLLSGCRQMAMQGKHFGAEVVNCSESLLLCVEPVLIAGWHASSNVVFAVAQCFQLYVHLFQLIQQIASHFR